MLKLENTERYVRDFKRFQKEIDKIQTPDAKAKAERLFADLKAQCKLISEAHNPSNSKSIDPRTARESIKKSVDIRTELMKLIEDSKRA